MATGNVYLVYSMFSGADPSPPRNNPRSKIMFAKSTNRGETWDRPVKLSKTSNLNQETNVAVNLGTGAICSAWRQLASKSPGDGLLVITSIDFGNSFSKPAQAFGFGPGVLFDQATGPVAGRRPRLIHLSSVIH